jgi:hypothetical protein
VGLLVEGARGQDGRAMGDPGEALGGGADVVEAQGHAADRIGLATTLTL